MVADLRVREPLDQCLHLALLGAVDVELDSGVEVLDVLPHDHEVHVAARRRDAAVGLRRTQVGIEVELLAKGDVHRPEPGAKLGGERSFERDAVATDRLDRVLGKGCAELRDRGRADVVHVPFDLDPCRFDRMACRLDDLRARAVTRDPRYAVGQCVLPLSRCVGHRTSARPNVVERPLLARELDPPLVRPADAATGCPSASRASAPSPNCAIEPACGRTTVRTGTVGVGAWRYWLAVGITDDAINSFGHTCRLRLAALFAL